MPFKGEYKLDRARLRVGRQNFAGLIIDHVAPFVPTDMYVLYLFIHVQLPGYLRALHVAALYLNTLRTGDGGLRFYITTVQDG